MINGVQTWVWAPVTAYLGNIKQQQKSAGFLGPRATKSCQFCNARPGSRRELDQDTIFHGQYHPQILALRHEAASIPSTTAKTRFFSTHGLAHEPSALAHISPALDTILSYSPNPAHSKYYGLVRKLYPNHWQAHTEP